MDEPSEPGPMKKLRASGALLAATTALAAWACGGDGTLTSPCIEVAALSPAAATIVVGDSVDFDADLTLCEQGEETQAQATWSSTDTTVATVNQAGLAVGRETGATTIQATAVSRPTVTAAARLEVLPR